MLNIKKNNTRMQTAFFLYMSAFNAHKTGSPIDTILCLSTFSWMLILLILEMKKTQFVIPCTKPLVYYTMFILFYYSSCLWTQSITDTMSYTSYLVQVFGSVFTLNYLIRTRDDVNEYLELILLSLIYMIAVLILKTPFSVWGSQRVGGAIGLNENDLGVRCSIGVLLSLYLGKKKPIIYRVSLLLFACVALFSGSRKAMMMVFLVFFIYFVWQTQGMKAVRNAAVAIFIIGITFYTIMNNPMLYAVLGYRIQIVLNRLNIGAQIKSIGYTVNSYSIEERTVLRNYALEMFFERPILGWGGDGFRTHMLQTGLARATYSHCNYTELLATLGIVGFLIYYSFEVLILFRGVKIFRKSRDQGALFVAAFAVVNMFAEFFYVSYYSVIIQVILVLAYYYVCYDIKEDDLG